MDRLIEKIELFNSPVEVGMRMVYLLTEIYPRDLDLYYLTYLDYALVYSKDLGGPESIHTPVSKRGGAFLNNSINIESGLKYMAKFGFIDMKISDQGITYLAGDNARAIINSINTEYTEKLNDRCRWISEFINNKSYKDIRYIFDKKGHLWGYESNINHEDNKL